MNIPIIQDRHNCHAISIAGFISCAKRKKNLYSFANMNMLLED